MSGGYFSNLLPEVLVRIFDFLSPKDLFNCCQVCLQWHNIANQNLLWYKRCLREGITGGLRVQKESNFWKSVFANHQRLCARWSGNPAESPAIISMHSYAVITDLVIHNDWAACSLDNGTIVVVDILSQVKIHTFRLNDKGSVWCLVAFTQQGQDFLASGGNDGVVRVWSITTGECHSELENLDLKGAKMDRSRMVRCLAVTEPRCEDESLLLVSGGRYFVLLVWNTAYRNCVHELHGHENSIRSVKANKEIAVSGSYDGTVRVWSLVRGELMHILRDHSDRVYAVHMAGQYVVSSSLDQTMRVWDPVEGVCLATLRGHTSLTKDMASDPGHTRLVSGNADCTVRVWSLQGGHCLQTLTGQAHGRHMAALTTVLVVAHKYVVSSSVDGIVKLWRLEDGAYVRDILNLQDFGATNVTVWKVVATDQHLVCATGSSVSTQPSKVYLYTFAAPGPPRPT